MNIVVAGGSGFLGQACVRRLLRRGDDVAVLSRHPSRVQAGRGVPWDGTSSGAWIGEIDRADAVVNLAGENIGDGRWTEARKQRLIDSRVDATGAIVAALEKAPSRKRTLIQASAVGFYGFDGEAEQDEDGSKGSGFLADLVDRWESAARPAAAIARLVILRFGVVLADDGGALQKMMLPFRFGGGGRVGDGRQWFSWIDRDDALAAIEWAIDREDARGVYNITAPEPVRNRDFATALGRAMHRPSLLPAPAIALRLLFGQMADEVLLGGQRVVPRRAQAEGFRFRFPAVETALGHVLDR